MNDFDAAARAESFWQLAGREEPFPRSLEATIAWVLPLAIVKLPRLLLSDVNAWLVARRIEIPCRSADRPLRACLLARKGHGVIFMDGSDPDDERRVSLAHELAHFICDYLDPRERAVRCLGEGVLEALDGDREPTVEEALSGVLRGITVGTFRRLIDRAVDGTVPTLGALDAEDRADRLALELIAPRKAVLERLAARGASRRDTDTSRKATEILISDFGLPAATARHYGSMITMSTRSPRSFREWLQV